MKKLNEMLLFAEYDCNSKVQAISQSSYSWSDMANELQAMGFTREEIRKMPDMLMFVVMRRPIISVFALDDVCKRRFPDYASNDNMSLQECLDAHLTQEQVKRLKYFTGAE